MAQKHIIVNSFVESVTLIWKNKRFFALLFILQFIFFVFFSLITLTYGVRMIEAGKAIDDYLSKLNLDETSATSNILEQKNVLGEDPLSISRNFNEMVRNFRIYVISVFVIVIIFASINWSVTINFLHKQQFHKFLKILFKNLVILIIYLGLVFTFFFLIFGVSLREILGASSVFSLLSFSFGETSNVLPNNLFGETSNVLISTLKFAPFLIFSLVLAYFMMVSLSLSYNTDFKNIFQRTLSIGLRKAHLILGVYIINILLFLLSASLLIYFVERNLFVLLLSIILITSTFVFGRIYLMNVVGKLEEKSMNN